MTHKENITAILESYFTGFREDIIESACTRILEQEASEQEPCEDAIRRQAVLASIKNLYPDMPIVDIFGARRKWLEKYAPYFECENAVEQLSSVNPTKTGHWTIDFICSLCGCKCYPFDIDFGDYNYCPNCGARMINEERGNKR